MSLLAVLAANAVASASASAAMPAYTNEAGGLIAGKLETLTTKAAGSPPGTLTSTLAGVKIEIQCEEAHGTGWIENSATTGMGLSLGLLHYLKCTMPKPAAGNCLIKNHLIHVLLVHNLLLLHPSTGQYLIDFYPDEGIYAAITIEGCTNTGINGTYAVKGSARALVNNTNLTYAFNNTSGSELKLGVNAAEYEDTLQTEMLGGGGIMIADGS